MSLGRKAAIAAGWQMAWRVVARLLGLVNTIVLARLLVPADFGLVAMAMTFEATVMTMSQFQVQDMLLRRPEADTRLHDAAFTLQVARALLGAAIVACGAPVAARWFSEPRLIPILLVIAITTAVNGLHNVGMVEFGRELRFDVRFKLEFIPALLQVLSTTLAAWFTHSYWALLLGLVIMRLSRAAMTYIIHPYRPRFSLDGWRELFIFSFWLWLAALAGMVWDQVDAFVVGPVFGSAGLGLYVIAVQAAALPTTELVEPISGVLLAGFAYAQRAKTAAVNPLAITSTLLMILFPVAIVISAGSTDLVAVMLGGKWAAAAPLVAIAAGNCLFQPFGKVTAAVLIARGNVRTQFVISVCSAILRAAFIASAATAGNLSLVVLAGLAALAGNAVLSLIALRSDLRSAFAEFVWGLLRMAVAAGLTAWVLETFGLGLHFGVRAVGTSGGALLHLVILGAVAVSVYGLALGTLWFLLGRPDGPEQLIFKVARQLATRSTLRGPESVES